VPPYAIQDNPQAGDRIEADTSARVLAIPEKLGKQDAGENTRSSSVAGLIAPIALITICLIFTGAGLLDRADHTRRVQVAVRQLEAQANMLNGLEWESMSRDRVTTESQEEFRAAEASILTITEQLADGRDHTEAMDALRDACSEYIGNLNREIVLIQQKRVQDASVLAKNVNDASFDHIQALVKEITEEKDEAAERAAKTSRIGLIIAAMVAVATILMYFRRFNRQTQRMQIAMVERALARKNEDRFRRLTENSADIIMIADARGGVSYVSPSVRSLLGRSEDMFMARSFLEWIHPEDSRQASAGLALLLSSEVAAKIEFRLQHADGRWLEFVCVARNLMSDPNVGGLLFNARDVTEDKKAKAILDFGRYSWIACAR
jgi:PAS domain S-box-containing protein